jgi:hypothetical protein
MDARPWIQAADGVVLDVRVTPRSGRDAIEGIVRRVRPAGDPQSLHAMLVRLTKGTE